MIEILSGIVCLGLMWGLPLLVVWLRVTEPKPGECTGPCTCDVCNKYREARDALREK